ncbi:MAG: hypothetical protein NTV63_05930 [Candidatus Woesearchaeota archaeon]|nr:hypothetical protein [Candidatus Woesearchaeota archaeon]
MKLIGIYGKKGQDITVKALFAIFIVIFVMFVIFSVIRSRGSVLSQKAQSEYYTLTDSFLHSLIGSSCISVGDYDPKGRQIATEAFLDEGKLNLHNRENQEIPCAESYDFMYSLTVVDSINGKKWVLGMKDEPLFSERKISIALPVSIKYNSTIPTINPGFAAATAYIGNIPSFYTSIKQACRSHEEISREIQTDYKIQYNSTSNIFRIGEYLFYPTLGCRVKDFTIEKGRYLIVISYNSEGNFVELLR